MRKPEGFSRGPVRCGRRRHPGAFAGPGRFARRAILVRRAFEPKAAGRREPLRCGRHRPPTGPENAKTPPNGNEFGGVSDRCQSPQTRKNPERGAVRRKFPLPASEDPANSVTYVRVSALICRASFLVLQAFSAPVSLLTLSTSWGGVTPPRFQSDLAACMAKLHFPAAGSPANAGHAQAGDAILSDAFHSSPLQQLNAPCGVGFIWRRPASPAPKCRPRSRPGAAGAAPG